VSQTLSEGAHAVPVVDSGGKIVRMLTQADVIRFLAAHLDELGPMAAMSVRVCAGAHGRHVGAWACVRGPMAAMSVRGRVRGGGPWPPCRCVGVCVRGGGP
jgi:hypothetical protein